MKTNILNETNSGTLADFCRKNHIVKLSLFGSTLRGESTAASDIDLLVEFHPDHIRSFNTGRYGDRTLEPAWGEGGPEDGAGFKHLF